MTSKSGIILFIFLMLYLLTGCQSKVSNISSSAENPELEKLQSLLWPQNEDNLYTLIDLDSINPAIKIIFDTGESSIPMLKKALNDKTNIIRRHFAALGFTLIGGEKSKKILQNAYEQTNDKTINTYLCYTMASTGSDEDIEYLVENVKSSSGGGQGAATLAALLSLRVLKPAEILSMVSSYVKSENSTIFLEDAEMAATLLGISGAKTPQAEYAQGRDQIVLTLFRYGIPRVNESKTFIETSSKRIWMYSDGSWLFSTDQMRQSDTNESYLSYEPPSIHFDVHVTPDKSKALATVGLIFGPKNGVGYSYILRSSSPGWKVVGLMLNWIS